MRTTRRQAGIGPRTQGRFGRCRFFFVSYIHVLFKIKPHAKLPSKTLWLICAKLP